MAIKHVDSTVPSEPELRALIAEKKFRYRRLEGILVGLQNNELESIPRPDIPMKRREQFNLVVMGMDSYNADIKGYEKIYQQYGRNSL